MILSQYKNKSVNKDLAVSLVIKFALQEGVLHDFIEEIKSYKPYKKGNDDARFVINYCVGLTLSYHSDLGRIFLMVASFNGLWEKWQKINDKWVDSVGYIKVNPV